MAQLTIKPFLLLNHFVFFLEQEYHRSLDTGDTRPCSAFAKIFEPKYDPEKSKHSSNLVKGKSMPSLR